jgi:hypothetical protein
MKKKHFKSLKMQKMDNFGEKTNQIEKNERLKISSRTRDLCWCVFPFDVHHILYKNFYFHVLGTFFHEEMNE